jgi:hypothetical protein
MFGKFAGPDGTLTPWVEVTDGAPHKNDGFSPRMKRKRNASLFPISRWFEQGGSGGSGGNSIKYKEKTKLNNYRITSIASINSTKKMFRLIY